MTLAQLRTYLTTHHVRDDAYSLEGGLPSEAYCIDAMTDSYVVYYSERGARTALQRFNTEADACNHMLELLRRDGLLHDTSIIDNPNLYQSAEGFSVEVLGRTGLAYRESGREMFIDSEVLTGDTGMVVYRDSVSSWKPPHDDIPVDDADRERIMHNIRHVLRQHGFEIDVI